MPEQSNTHAQILKEADAYLSKNDITNYWLTIEKISPLYGRVATDVATGGPHGLGARERLQDAAEDQLGRRFTEAELDGIESAIAKADRNIRQSNLKEHGVAGVSLKDTDNYHMKVFKDNRLSADTYTLHGLVNAMDDEAKSRLDTDPDFTSDTLKSIASTPGKSIPAGAQYGIDTLEAIGRRITNADAPDENQELPAKEAIPSHDQAGPDEGKPSAPDDRPKPQSSPPEPEAEFDNLSPDVARIRTAFMPRSDLPETRDDLLLKFPHILTADEVRDLHFAYWDAPTSSPERDDINDHLTAFYEHTYGTDPMPVDDTGKAVDPGSKHPTPTKSSPVAMKSGGDLADGLKRVAKTLTRAAANDGAAPVVTALQRGLNTLGHRLRVDGDPGPKTRAAVKKTLVQNGPAKIDEARALGAFNGFASDIKSKKASVAANDLDGFVRKTVEPLFDTKVADTEEAVTPKPMIAGAALQRSLNDLAANDTAPLKEDGVLGAKTVNAFQRALTDNDTDDLAGYFASALGFS